MGTRKAYIDNTGKFHLTNSVRRINRDKIFLKDIYLKQRTELLIHIASKARTKRRKLWFDLSRATYPQTLRVA